MADLAVIVPSRGRPRQLRELVDAIYDTAETDVRVVAAVDDDDPTLDAYGRALEGVEVNTVVYRGGRRSLSGWTNHLAQLELEGASPPRYLASLGDDHRPITPGWDRKLIEAAEALGPGGGWAYGDDLLQGARLPTAWVVSAEITRALGWVMLPACAHMYVDNAVLELGRHCGRIVYRRDVVIEHLHPVAHKGQWDDSYRESNAPERYAADREALEAWKRDGLAADGAKVLACRPPVDLAVHSVRHATAAKEG